MQLIRYAGVFLTLASLIGFSALGCDNSSGRVDDDDYDNEVYGVPPGCDPDGGGACVEDWFLCIEDDQENKHCEGQNPATPDGGDWDCVMDGEEIACTGDHIPDGTSWDCVDNGDGTVTCSTDAYTPSDDGSGDGDWNCWLEGEFVICEYGEFDDSGGDADSDTDTDTDTDTDGDGDIPEGGNDICFFDVDDPDGPPLVTGSYSFETLDGTWAIHVVLAFNEHFVDNTYGVNSADGYRGGPNGHRFHDLVASDAATVGFLDGDGNEILLARFDYISESGTEASGYDCLGVTGGDGAVETGNAEWVLEATSSLDRNFNELGCVFLEDSPVAGECPGWDYRVVYEMWIDASIFGPSGFGSPWMTFVHASPSRTTDTIYIEPGPCP